MKPTTEQIIDWGRTALNETGDLIPTEWNMKLLEAICSAAYEAGRKDESEDCAKQVGQQWDAFEELKAAHYRNSPEPFDPFRFHRDLSVIFFSRDMAAAIRARREQ